MNKHLLSPRHFIYRSLILASVVWIFVLIGFYKNSDVEVIGREEFVEKEELSERFEVFKSPPSAKKVLTNSNFSTRSKFKNFFYKNIVTPIPEHIIKQLGIENPGANGQRVDLPKVSAEIKKRIDRGWKNHQFNEFVSDLIPLNRTLPDPRDEYCKQDLYLDSRYLPATSVIFIFHNEAWSTLLRSVHSVIDRSPEHLITEIILVDDFSNMRN